METLENLRDEYEKYCQEHWIAINEGNSRIANLIHKKITQITQKAKDSNLFDIFIPFLEHENENTKLWTACLYLDIYPKEALKVLKELSKSSDFIISFEAKATIKLYKEGKWEEWISK